MTCPQCNKPFINDGSSSDASKCQCAYHIAENEILVYDINSVPEGTGIDLEKIMYIYKNHQVILYDSYGGHKPFLVKGSTELKFLDADNEEHKEEIQKIINESKDKS